MGRKRIEDDHHHRRRNPKPSGGRADGRGRHIVFRQQRIQPVFSPGNRAEQDPKTWRHALFGTLKKVGEFLVCSPEAEPDCIAITSQRASVIPVDEGGNPLRNALMWQDKRARAECGWIESKISREELYHACGLRLDPYFSLPKMLWLRSNEPEIWSKTKSSSACRITSPFC